MLPSWWLDFLLPFHQLGHFNFAQRGLYYFALAYAVVFWTKLALYDILATLPPDGGRNHARLGLFTSHTPLDPTGCAAKAVPQGIDRGGGITQGV